jgi:formylglycine-generating enzyme required for sulfatase activity
MRGGSWYGDAVFARVAYRFIYYLPDGGDSLIGFRCARRL